MKNYSIGGRAYRNGISLSGEKYNVKTTIDKNGKISTKIEENKQLVKGNSVIHRIPFIRVYPVIYDALRTEIRMILIRLFIMIVLSMMIFNYLDMDTTQVNQDNSSFYINLMPYIILLLIMISIKITPMAKFHGAEHMVIATLLNNKEITNENIEMEDKENRGCGSVLAIFMISIKILLDIISVNPIVSLFLALSISYELFLLKEGFLYKLLTPIYKFCLFIQTILLTTKPSKTQIDVARIAMLKLKELEGWK